MTKKILQRFEQELAKPAATFNRLSEPIALQYQDKEILAEILRVLYGVTVAANEQEDRSPVGSAKLSEGVARRLFIRF
jgi:hypothetical protein